MSDRKRSPIPFATRTALLLLVGSSLYLLVGCSNPPTKTKEIVNFEFQNRATEAIRVDKLSDLDVASGILTTPGVVGPNASAAILLITVTLPARTTIVWRFEKNREGEPQERRDEVDLSSLHRTSRADWLVFEFGPDEKWNARFESRD